VKPDVVQTMRLINFENAFPAVHVHRRIAGERKMRAVKVAAQENRLPGSTLIPLGALRSRLNELPKDKEESKAEGIS
jgi:hypothetical protein